MLLRRAIIGYCLNFVKSGTPNGNRLPEWKAYKAEDAVVMELGIKPEPKPGLSKEEMIFLPTK